MKKLTSIIDTKKMVQPASLVSEERRLELIANLQELIDLEKIKDTMTLEELVYYKVKSAAYNWQETPTSVINELQVQSDVDEIMEAIEKSQEPHISILEPGSEAAILFEASKPLMKLLNDNYHPHCTIIVNHGNVQVYEGICSTGFTNEFFND